MPQYELCLIYKALQRPLLHTAIKRTAETILERGGIIRSFENLGKRALPYKMSAHKERHTEGNYFIVNFDSSGKQLEHMKEYLERDIDVIRPSFLRKEKEFRRPCLDGPCFWGELTEEKSKEVKRFMGKTEKL
ncbi:unnamed protein product [Owenia fusiformis]|uniref:Small ribosomal subunit protein bS6m n=1 Tax=Owenia fusiformis TaxID=6347 RepID=A0A8J1TAU8_OWEFU|nr:unnamed protein product [Owenia fusiformis]